VGPTIHTVGQACPSPRCRSVPAFWRVRTPTMAKMFAGLYSRDDCDKEYKIGDKLGE